MAVQWDSYKACNYFETYDKRGNLILPNTEIKFVREISQKDSKKLLFLKNPLILRPNDPKWPN